MSIDVHQTAVLNGEIVFEGSNIVIGPYAVLQGNVILGENVTIGAGSMLGMAGEHHCPEKGYHGVIIGAGSIIRENVIIHAGLHQPTILGNDCFVMSANYIAHDCVLEDGVVMSAGCRLAGHSYVMKRSNLGMGVLLHQYSVVGSYSMVGMGGVVIKGSRVEPGMKYAGNPIRFLSRNSHALEKYEVGAEELATETERFYAML